MTTLSPTAWNRPWLRIGHGGAAGHAPANTLDSLRIGLELGVDMIEFDVRACRDALVLLHDDNLADHGRPGELASRLTLDELRALPPGKAGPVASLTEALDLVRGRALLNIDLKAVGYEPAVLQAMASRGLSGDVLYSTHYPSSLRLIRSLAPDSRTGLSFPEDKSGASNKPYLKPVVTAVLAWLRWTLPWRVLAMISDAQASAVMLYHPLLSRRVVDVVHQAGHQVFTWTIDDSPRLRVVHALGVDGIASNYPERFAGLGEEGAAGPSQGSTHSSVPSA
ncbi:MAG TPA: glycerophosphodiester phosphodiesterase [Anaerolineae bacterium]|nr:glycerophosphodiester phosphodiesterase [Anaerolineae bacterium]